MKAVLWRSPKAASPSSTEAAFLVTGSDSPVRAASSICRLAVSSRRTSAGTKLPASRKTMSPGTSSRAGTLMRCPSRRMAASGAASFFKASSACSARRSCTTPIIVFRTTIARMASASTHSLSRMEISEAPSSSQMTNELICPHTACSSVVRLASFNAFSPTVFRRSAACWLVNPISSVVSSRRTTSSPLRLYQFTTNASSLTGNLSLGFVLFDIVKSLSKRDYSRKRLAKSIR